MDKNPENKTALKKATFAGGCFWCLVQPFEALEGVYGVVTGYTGGKNQNPTYKEVCSGGSGHYEAVQITFDPSETGYERLVDIFMRQINPIDAGGQFYDRGSQYQTAIFYHDEEQKQIAEAYIKKLNASGKFSEPVATKLLKAVEFYPAEEYHQDYHKKNPEHYNAYKLGSGRQKFIEEVWGEKHV